MNSQWPSTEPLRIENAKTFTPASPVEAFWSSEHYRLRSVGDLDPYVGVGHVERPLRQALGQRLAESGVEVDDLTALEQLLLYLGHLVDVLQNGHPGARCLGHVHRLIECGRGSARLVIGTTTRY